MNDQSIITKHIINEDKTKSFFLSDLVMVQMIGDFDNFLDVASDGYSQEYINNFIDGVKQSSTSLKLFPGIVNKTIEAQFGEKHSAIRELGQNAIDSYNPNNLNKIVIFRTSEQDDYIVLKVRDFGCGMSFKDTIKELLIPYNSAKEFDPTKIGEHGIGWYSIVDLADLVKVISKKIDSDQVSQALIYRDDEYNWKSMVSHVTDKAFSEEMKIHGVINKGTEVCAYIKKNKTNTDNIRNYIYLHLGLVSNDNASIYYDRTHINSVHETYSLSKPALVNINGVDSELSIGVSKRLMRGSQISKEFEYRNKYIHQIIYTQRGLFVRFGDIPFDNNTIHFKLISDMIKLGLDFWINIPDSVTLTKGRNNIISDHQTIVDEASYRAFENLFLNVLLEDKDITDHSSNILLTSISEIFKKGYAGEIELTQRIRYPFTRRMMIFFGRSSNNMLNLMRSISQATKNGIEDLWKLLDQVNSIKVKAPSRKTVIKILSYTLIFLPVISGVGIGTILLYKRYGLILFKIIFSSAISVAIIALFVHECFKLFNITKDLALTKWPKFKWPILKLPKIDFSLLKCGKILSFVKYLLMFTGKFFIEVIKMLADTSFNILKAAINIFEKVINISSVKVKNSIKFILKFFGLYMNMDERKEKKRMKLRKKISKIYLCSAHKNSFFHNIMAKEIIPAIYYYSPYQESLKRYSLRTSVKEILNDIKGIFRGEQPTYDYTYYDGNKDIQRRDIRISIDKMIDLYLRGKLICRKGFTTINFNDGDVVVQKINPIVLTVIEHLDKISYDVRNEYDVKLLEDYLENIMRTVLVGVSSLIFMIYTGLVVLAPFLLLISLLPESRNYYIYTYQYYTPDKIHQSFSIIKGISGILFLHFFLFQIFRRRKDSVKDPLANFKFYQTFNKLVSFLLSIPARILKRLLKTSLSIQPKHVLKRITAHGTSTLGLIKGVLSETTHILIPILRVLDPRKYRSYGRNTYIIIKEILKEIIRIFKEDSYEERKRRQEEKYKRKLEKERKRKEKLKLLEDRKRLRELSDNLFEKIYHNVIDWYSRTWINYVLGNTMVQGKNVKKLSKTKLKIIIKSTGAGQAYLDYMNSIEKLDEILSSAINIKQLPVIYSYNENFYGRGHIELSSKYRCIEKHLHNRTILDNVRKIRGLINPYGSFENKEKKDYLVYNNLKLSLFVYRTIEYLLDLKILQVIMKRSKETDKKTLKRQLIKYMQNNNINPVEEVRKILPPIDETADALYYIPPEEISALSHMTLRRLKYQSLKYKIEKESLINKRKVILENRKLTDESEDNGKISC